MIYERVNNRDNYQQTHKDSKKQKNLPIFFVLVALYDAKASKTEGAQNQWNIHIGECVMLSKELSHTIAAT